MYNWGTIAIDKITQIIKLEIWLLNKTHQSNVTWMCRQFFIKHQSIKIHWESKNSKFISYKLKLQSKVKFMYCGIRSHLCNKFMPRGLKKH